MGLHYLNDFILVAKDQGIAQKQKKALRSTFKNLQVPMKQSKLEGPDTCLTFLGIEIDTEKLQLRLKRKKQADLRALLASYMCHTSIQKKEIERILYISLLAKWCGQEDDSCTDYTHCRKSALTQDTW